MKSNPKPMRMHLFLFMLLFGLFPTACQDETDPAPEDDTLSYDFETSTEGWLSGFADLPLSGRDIFELEAGHATLPEPLDTQEGALRISGHNRSDDLFMFWKRPITGLQPETTYEITFSVAMASQYPQSSAGIGGSPGGAVHFKVGAVTGEPMLVEETVGSRDYHRLDIDKGNQSQSGEDMRVLGTVGIPGEEFTYQLITFSNKAQPTTVRTDTEGTCWVIIGTDSGFEGKTTLYYDRIELQLEAVE